MSSSDQIKKVSQSTGISSPNQQKKKHNSSMFDGCVFNNPLYDPNYCPPSSSTPPMGIPEQSATTVSKVCQPDHSVPQMKDTVEAPIEHQENQAIASDIHDVLQDIISQMAQNQSPTPATIQQLFELADTYANSEAIRNECNSTHPEMQMLLAALAVLHTGLRILPAYQQKVQDLDQLQTSLAQRSPGSLTFFKDIGLEFAQKDGQFYIVPKKD